MAKEFKIPSTTGGSFNVYLATATRGVGPGVVIIQEIFGINKTIRQIADTYAAAGYLAIAPDLFWRQDPGVQLNPDKEGDWAKALQLYNGFVVDKGVEDLSATVKYLRKLDGCTGKVGTVGFCLGGKLAYLMATRSNAECNVSYYGVGIETVLSEAGNIKKPLMLHIAENDQFVPPAAQEKIKAGLSSNPLVTIHSYPGVNHGFGRVGGDTYVPQVAALANSRTLEFFKQHLG